MSDDRLSAKEQKILEDLRNKGSARKVEAQSSPGPEMTDEMIMNNRKRLQEEHPTMSPPQESSMQVEAPMPSSPEPKPPIRTNSAVQNTPPEPLIKNTALDQLKESFGIDHLKEVDEEINGVTFTLKALSGRLLSWVDSTAQFVSLTQEDYGSNFQIAMAAASVHKINGVDLKTAFEEDNDRMARAKFFDFLFDTANPELVKSLFNSYNDKIEPLLNLTSNILTKPGEDTVYTCPKCDTSYKLSKRDKAYYCANDGEVLREYVRGHDVPLR